MAALLLSSILTWSTLFPSEGCPICFNLFTVFPLISLASLTFDHHSVSAWEDYKGDDVSPPWPCHAQKEREQTFFSLRARCYLSHLIVSGESLPCVSWSLIMACVQFKCLEFKSPLFLPYHLCSWINGIIYGEARSSSTTCMSSWRDHWTFLCSKAEQL